MMQKKDFLTQLEKINKKVDINMEFPDWKRSIQFIVKGKKDFSFHFVVDGKKVSKVAEGDLPKADVYIEGKQESISNLFKGDLAMIGAFITQELTIRGAIGDAVGANVLIQAARVF